jgi:hypothetical protein
MLDQELLRQFPGADIYDLAEFYSELVPFTINSMYPIHRWYRFKEGFSKDLVNLILGSMPDKIDRCLDPFAGSGTTPLVCQSIGIPCHSIEVNPFIQHIAKVKLRTEYTVKRFDDSISHIKIMFNKSQNISLVIPEMSTITEREGSKKWLFSKSVLKGILTLRYLIEQLDPIYCDLLLVTLASILPDIGNTKKDGKCVRYKTNWRMTNLSPQDVMDAFISRAQIFREDIEKLQNESKNTIHNEVFCQRGNALDCMKLLPKESFNLTITSPPYLNSFDYTDVYMPELWALGFVNKYEDVQKLRMSTLRSHVQVKWKMDSKVQENEIELLLSKLTEEQINLWNHTIPDMIRGYFLDMQIVLGELSRVTRLNGMICMVVGTSSYHEVTIPTDLIIAKMAESHGLQVKEIKVVRNLRRSSHQIASSNGTLPLLRESIILLNKIS